MKCYAVTSGCYSDYGVWCVFQHQRDAKRYLQLRGYDLKRDERGEWSANGDHWEGPRVEEFDFYPPGKVPHAKANA